MTKITWDYRVLLKDGTYTICEVYFKDGDRIDRTYGPEHPTGETMEYLQANLEHMLDAIQKPVINGDKLDIG
jgi:hypothetical protein